MTSFPFGAAMPRVWLLGVLEKSPPALSQLSIRRYPLSENTHCSHEPLSWITAPVHQYDTLHSDFLLLSFFLDIPFSSLIAFSS